MTIKSEAPPAPSIDDVQDEIDYLTDSLKHFTPGDNEYIQVMDQIDKQWSLFGGLVDEGRTEPHITF